MKKWNTDDDCTNCGNQGMIFYEEDTEYHDDHGTIHYGILSCPRCGTEEVSSCYDYQVPSV